MVEVVSIGEFEVLLKSCSAFTASDMEPFLFSIRLRLKCSPSIFRGYFHEQILQQLSTYTNIILFAAVLPLKINDVALQSSAFIRIS